MKPIFSSIKLPLDKAKELIEFISKTNYFLAPYDGCFFVTKESALAFVESNCYEEDEPIKIFFDTAKGNYWDSMSVSFDNGKWIANDLQKESFKVVGDTIQEMVELIRDSCEPSSQFRPVKLIVNG